MRSQTTTYSSRPTTLEPPVHRAAATTIGERDMGIDIRPLLRVGAPVEVRSRFDDRWTHGFSVAVAYDDAYQLRRLSDGSILPAWFPAAMVRPDPAA